VLKKCEEDRAAPVSFETPIGEDEETHLGDFVEDRGVVSPSEAAINLNLKEQMASMLKTLTTREERIIKMRFGLDDGNEHTLEEVGQTFAVDSRTHPPDFEAKALRKLRHPSRFAPVPDLSRRHLVRMTLEPQPTAFDLGKLRALSAPI